MRGLMVVRRFAAAAEATQSATVSDVLKFRFVALFFDRERALFSPLALPPCHPNGECDGKEEQKKRGVTKRAWARVFSPFFPHSRTLAVCPLLQVLYITTSPSRA